MTSESRAPAPGPEPSSSGVQETSLERSDSASEDATEGKTKASGQGRNGASGNGCNPMFCPFCDDRLAATDSQGVVPLSERPVFSLSPSAGYTHLLTVVDRSAHWPEAVPLSITSAQLLPSL